MHTKIERNALILYSADWTWPGVMKRQRKNRVAAARRGAVAYVFHVSDGAPWQDVAAANREVAGYHFGFGRARANETAAWLTAYTPVCPGLRRLHERAPSFEREVPPGI